MHEVREKKLWSKESGQLVLEFTGVGIELRGGCGFHQVQKFLAGGIQGTPLKLGAFSLPYQLLKLRQTAHLLGRDLNSSACRIQECLCVWGGGGGGDLKMGEIEAEFK
jgi:hypothetical protein